MQPAQPRMRVTGHFALEGARQAQEILSFFASFAHFAVKNSDREDRKILFSWNANFFGRERKNTLRLNARSLALSDP